MAKINIQLTKQQQTMVGVGVVLVGGLAWGYYAYVWKPWSERIANAVAKIEELDSKISTAKRAAARRDTILKELDSLNKQATDAERRLPKAKDLPAVIDTISRLTKSYKVDLISFSPGSAAPKQYFIEIPYTVSLSGNYHNIGRFLAAVALEERIFNVRNVVYSLGATGAPGVPNLTVNFILVSYQYKG